MIYKGDIILHQGDVVQSSHILVLAPTGFKSVPLTQGHHVAIWPTGKKMANGKRATRDASGPYLTAAAEELGSKRLSGAF